MSLLLFWRRKPAIPPDAGITITARAVVALRSSVGLFSADSMGRSRATVDAGRSTFRLDRHA